MAAKIAFPKSKGRLKLNSTDPRENPSVKFNYLERKEDLDTCIETVLHLQHVASSETVMLFLGTQAQDKLLGGDQDLKSFSKENVGTYYHYHGGCVVGSVVDENYKVNGMKRLTVVDGSTFEESPGSNPMATVFNVGKISRNQNTERTRRSPQPQPQP